MIIVPPPIAVTGSTGNLGGRVAALLAEAGVKQRLLARTPRNAPPLVGATVLQAAYENTTATRTALLGAETVFLVSASESRDRLDQHCDFVDAAVAAGVRHLVYVSFVGAAQDAVFTLARDHYATEEYIRASGLYYTFLRDSFYADFMPGLVGADGIIRGPAGDGKVAVVAREDIARTAVDILRAPDAHLDMTYELTGPEALSLTEIAQVLNRVGLGPVSSVNETIEQAYASRASFGVPQWQLDAWVSTYTAIASGALENVSGDIEAITGVPPMTLAQLLGS
ncbi:SDR family oxidoreductase [Paeniglutamicibacter gangotriensis]|uniref:SDR family oxidoreductase n=1 Tax=Paeniglutamicibacter gangotriensis TaxID=254787 RepID=A0A5B0ED48_9MICC|nr:SDR family oxidoreductase [Paeniglutamicibacter gangotriensis]KAA0976242.1 SDR family oxidoreductase [Paeniglutamicibacter gangotriensis]